MRTNDKKALIIILILFAIIIGVVCFSNRKYDPYFTKVDVSKVKFENTKILKLNKKQKEKFYNSIIDYLNRKKYNYYNKIVFKKTINKGSYYILFYLNNDYKTLIECKYNNLSFYWMGDSLSPDVKSKRTKVTYLKIMNPKKYKEQKQEESDIDKSDQGMPDANEGGRF